MSGREVLKIAAEHLRDLNQGLENIGSATNFAHYTENTYIPVALCKMAKSTQDRYGGVIKNYLKPAFGRFALRDLTPLTVDRYFAGLADSELAQESLDKIRDVLASIRQAGHSPRPVIEKSHGGSRTAPGEARDAQSKALHLPGAV
jgi:hypothetical protein